MLGINGSELSNFSKLGSDKASVYAGKFVYTNASYTVHTFNDSVSPSGKNEYPFEFKTPEWLPSSTIYCVEFNHSVLKVRYGLWAQIKPADPKDYVDVKKTISVFRTSKEIQLFRPRIPVPTMNYQNRIISKVGGLMGLGASQCLTDVIFDRNQYYTGETCNVRIICDNSTSSVAVKSFKIKLKRKVFASGELVTQYQDRDDQMIKSSKYLYQFKDTEAKCGAK